MTLKTHRIPIFAAVAVAVAIFVPPVANAQGTGGNSQMMTRQGQMGPGQMGQGQMGPGQMMMRGQMGSGQMGQGQMGPGQMGPGGMYQDGMYPGMMGQGMMNYGMMGQMGGGMSGGGMMMGPRMMGMVALGNRVIPMPDISAADVRRFLEYRVELQGYARLRVGNVTAKDDDTILAEIDTVDGALVQRLEIDRHTGLMTEIDVPTAKGQQK